MAWGIFVDYLFTLGMLLIRGIPDTCEQHTKIYNIYIRLVFSYFDGMMAFHLSLILILDETINCDYALQQCIKSSDLVTPDYRDHMVNYCQPINEQILCVNWFQSIRKHILFVTNDNRDHLNLTNQIQWLDNYWLLSTNKKTDLA